MNDKALSQAIISDLAEAKQQMQPSKSRGFAWGIREAIWGAPNSDQSVSEPIIPRRSKDEMKDNPSQVLEKEKNIGDEGA